MSADDADDPAAPPPEPVGADLARELLAQAKARSRRKPTEEQRIAAAAARAERRRAAKTERGGEPARFGSTIEALLKVRGWEHDARVHAVLSRWDAIVGPEIAGHCTPASLRDGELSLTAESTAWATQLRLMERQIKDRVNADLGAAVVRSVRVAGPTRARRPGEWRVAGSRGDRDTYG